MIFSYQSAFKGSLFLLILFMIPVILKAQGVNAHWTFGDKMGIKFSNGVPALFPSQLFTLEGCAAVSNSNGQLLFYSDGNKVFDANHQVMPNGSGLLGNLNLDNEGSSCQGVVISPAIGINNRYYIFTLDPHEVYTRINVGYLRYSVVDMSLNGGLGDVVQGQKNIVMDSLLGEKMMSATGAGCYSWLVTHERDGNKFHAFKIDASGIASTPVISASGPISPSYNHRSYQLVFSPNDSLLVNTSFNANATLHDFDRSTGIISNPRILNLDRNAYGCAFSPDGSKLYFASSDLSRRGLTQFDLSQLPNMTNVNNSFTLFATGSRLLDLRTAPNGKIYGIDGSTNKLFVINTPNQAGAMADFIPDAGITFPLSIKARLGTDVIKRILDSTAYYTHDTVVCFDHPIQVFAPSGYRSYLWNDGSTLPHKSITSGGIKWVVSTAECGMRIDTFKVIDAFAQFQDLGQDTVLCIGDSIMLNAGVPEGHYTWNDGSTQPSRTVTSPGTYIVTVNAASCTRTATIRISQKTLEVDLGNDSTLCEGDTVLLNAAADGVRHLWQDGNTQAILPATTSGTYWVKVTQAACVAMDTVKLNFNNCNCKVSFPNAFTPNNDGRNDTFGPLIDGLIESYDLSLYNRWGQCIFTSFDPRTKWDGTFQNRQCDIGTFFYKLKVRCFNSKDQTYSGETILIR